MGVVKRETLVGVFIHLGKYGMVGVEIILENVGVVRGLVIERVFVACEGVSRSGRLDKG